MKNKKIISTNILITVAVIAGLSLAGGLGYMVYQNWFAETVEKAETKNCGTTDVFTSNKRPSEINFEQDSTLVCLGESVTGECKQAKAVFETKNSGDITTKVKKTDSKCLLSFSYGEKEQIPNEEKKPRANKYIQCPVESLSSQPYLVFEEAKNLSERPGKYAASLYLRLNYPMEGTQRASEMGCSGTLLEYFKDKKKKIGKMRSITKVKNKGKETGVQSIMKATIPLVKARRDRGDYNTIGDAILAAGYDVSKTKLEQMTDSKAENHFVKKFLQSRTLTLNYKESKLGVSESKLRVCKWHDNIWEEVGGSPNTSENMVEVDITESGNTYIVCYPKKS